MRFRMNLRWAGSFLVFIALVFPQRYSGIAVGSEVSPLVIDASMQCKGRCLNPHPGQFRWWYGQARDQCWVEVWRQWPEGCTHWQLFNRCTGWWDADQYGNAKVFWTCCQH